MKKDKEQYYKYLKSTAWKTKRTEIFLERNGICERCNKSLLTSQFQVHHKTYKNIFNEQNKDLELLCKPCHEKEHKNKNKPKKQKPPLSKNYLNIISKNHTNNLKKLLNSFNSGKLTKLGYDIKVKQANNRLTSKIGNYHKRK